MKKIKARELRIRNCHLVKLIVVFVLVILGLRYDGYVNAGMNDSVMEENRKDGVYAVVTVNGETRIFPLNMYELSGRVAYRIDLSDDVTTSLYHSTNDFLVSYLSEEQIDYIRSISYFGYGYENNIHYQDYLAAQELIWEYLSNGSASVRWSTKLDGKGSIYIDSYTKKILRLRDLYSKEPDFDWINGQDYMPGEEIVLVDNNGVLSDYEVISNNCSDISIEGNKLIIRVGNVIGKENITLKRKGYYDYDSLLYYSDDSDMFVSNGNYKELENKLTFNIIGVSFKGQVVDKKTGVNIPLGQASLKGAKYQLYDKDKNLLGTYVTDENGGFEVNNLLVGTYYIKQLEASEGYLVNEEELKFELKEDNFELKLEQEVIGNVIEIKKVYGDEGNYLPEAGILFQIYDNKENIYDSLITDQEGVASIWLPYGNYKVCQSNVTLGYSKVKDFEIVVKNLKDGKVIYNLVNEFVKVKIRVVTLMEGSDELLSLEGFSYMIREKDNINYLDFGDVSVFKTNDKGELIIPILFSYGDYVLEQIDVPEGILLNSEGQQIKVNNKSNFSLIDDSLIMDVKVYNEVIMGKINVLVTEERFYTGINDYGYEKVPKAEVEISLVANENIIVNNKVIYQKGEEVYSGKTGDDGKLIIDNIPLGSYCLINKDTGEEKCFILESTDNSVKFVEEDLEFTYKLKKENIIIHNMTDEGENISEATFEILNDNGTVVYTGITNEDGVVKVENILAGDYCVRQKRVSSEYQENNNEICFLLDGEEIVNFINGVVTKQMVSVPNTLSETIGTYEVVLVLFMIGIGILVYKKIFASRLYR